MEDPPLWKVALSNQRSESAIPPNPNPPVSPACLDRSVSAAPFVSNIGDKENSPSKRPRLDNIISSSPSIPSSSPHSPISPFIPHFRSQITPSAPKRFVFSPAKQSPIVSSILKSSKKTSEVSCQTDGFFSRHLIKDINSNTALDVMKVDGLVDVVELAMKSNKDLLCNVKCLHLQDKVLLTLMKLRCNYTLQHLSDLMDISLTTASVAFRNIIKVLGCIFKPLVQTIPPPDVCRIIQPRCYKNNLTKDCTMSVDCTDIKINNVRSNFSKLYATRSNYRNIQSLKCLIAILPSNCICFCSSLFPGRISDREICVQSGFLDQLSPGHKLAVDKGFLVEDLLPLGVSLCMPSFKQTGQQFTHSQVFRSMAISSARTHVERVNERIKNFKILTDFPFHYLDIASDIMIVICGIVNMTSPLQAENIKPLKSLFM